MKNALRCYKCGHTLAEWNSKCPVCGAALGEHFRATYEKAIKEAIEEKGFDMADYDAINAQIRNEIFTALLHERLNTESKYNAMIQKVSHRPYPLLGLPIGALFAMFLTCICDVHIAVSILLSIPVCLISAWSLVGYMNIEYTDREERLNGGVRREKIKALEEIDEREDREMRLASFQRDIHSERNVELDPNVFMKYWNQD